nr:hypothetical protein CFP56_12030 [Quercus suber]
MQDDPMLVPRNSQSLTEVVHHPITVSAICIYPRPQRWTWSEWPRDLTSTPARHTHSRTTAIRSVVSVFFLGIILSPQKQPVSSVSRLRQIRDDHRGVRVNTSRFVVLLYSLITCATATSNQPSYVDDCICEISAHAPCASYFRDRACVKIWQASRPPSALGFLVAVLCTIYAIMIGLRRYKSSYMFDASVRALRIGVGTLLRR